MRARLWLFILFFMTGCAQSGRSPVDSLVKGQRAAAVVFLSPDCPLSQSSTLTLNELRARFRAAGVEFYGIFPGPAGAEAAKSFAKTYNIQFPVLADPDFQMADFLEATTTPEVFVLDGAGRTLYAGAIDNRAAELGQLRTTVTATYLGDALTSVAEGRNVSVAKTRAVGCFIERARRSHLLPDTERR